MLSVTTDLDTEVAVDVNVDVSAVALVAAFDIIAAVEDASGSSR